MSYTRHKALSTSADDASANLHHIYENKKIFLKKIKTTKNRAAARTNLTAAILYKVYRYNRICSSITDYMFFQSKKLLMNDCAFAVLSVLCML